MTCRAFVCCTYLSLTVHLIPDVCLWMSYILRRYTYREYRVILKSHPGVSKIVKHFQLLHKELTNVFIFVVTNFTFTKKHLGKLIYLLVVGVGRYRYLYFG
uniref:Uncharacterized protein n=1 Tax=Cacopsylla melanoneura TaxID=428564 RepID=A0A8D8V3T4_9HEMI